MVNSKRRSGGEARATAPLGWIWRATGRFSGTPTPEAPPGLLDALPYPVALLDAEGRVQAASARAARLFGLDPLALHGERLADALFARDAREAFGVLLQRAAAGAEPTPASLAAVHADGSDVPLDVAIGPFADGGLFAVSLRPAAAPSPESDAADARRRTLRTILDLLPDPVVAVNRAGQVLFRNQAAARDLGIGEPGGPLPEPDGRAAEAVMRAAEPDVADETAPGGTIRQTTRVPVEAGGAVVGMVALARDVTAQRADADRLRGEKQAAEAERQAAEAAARSTGEMLATTSHEVRTLMSGVTGMTRLLLDTPLDDDQRDYVETIAAQSATLLRVVNDVLDLSKMDAGMLAVERAPYAPAQVATAALAVVRQQAEAKGLALAADVDPALPAAVLGDALRLQQVLANLLTNAVKFTDAGAVTLRLGAEDGRLAVAVEDTGVGIAPDRLDAVFDRFVQADASTARTHGGSGLGLTICRRLVGMMGGTLSAESAPGGGSVFRFSLPLEPAEAHAADAAGRPATVPPPDAEPQTEEPQAEPQHGEGPAPEPPAVLSDTFSEVGAEDLRVAPDLPPEPARDLESGSAAAAVGDVPHPASAPEAEPLPEAEPQADAQPEPSPLSEPDAPSEEAPPVPSPVVSEEPASSPSPVPYASPSPQPPSPQTSEPDRPTRQRVMETFDILPSARVLLVEDDPVMQKVTAHTLRRLGYSPTVLDNGRKGMMAVRAKAYDVVLMDIMMPVMDGLEATRQIRADPGPHPEPAIVMLTANAMQNDRDAGYKAGCDAYLTKPVDPRELATTIERAIRERAGSESEAAGAA